MTTSMEEAFAKAGKLSPKRRLRKFAEIAIATENFAAAKAAFLQALMSDAGAMRELMGDSLTKRASEYLHDLWNKKRGTGEVHVREHERRAKGFGGQQAVATQDHGAANGGGSGQQRHETPMAFATPAAANSPERRAAARARLSWFDRVQIGERKIGDMTYREAERAAAIRLHDGVSNLRQSYLLRRLCRSVPYSPAIEDQPVRAWADEKVIEAADLRWNELVAKIPRLSVDEIDAMIQLEAKQ